MPFTFLPFSSGKRGCTGKHLARLECKIMVANLFYHYKLDPDPNQNYEVATTLSSRPKYKVFMKMTNRRKPR
jgi:cytochrome P450